MVFLVVIWRPKKSFTSISYPFSQRFVVLVRGHPLIIVWLWEFFSPIRSNSRVFSVWLSGVHQFRFIHSQLSVIILLFYRCFVQVIFNRLVISLFSCILILSSIFVHFIILPGVSLSSLRSFSILTVVCSRFYSMVIISTHSLFSKSYRWFVEDLPKFMLYLS